MRGKTSSEMTDTQAERQCAAVGRSVEGRSAAQHGRSDKGAQRRARKLAENRRTGLRNAEGVPEIECRLDRSPQEMGGLQVQ